MCSSRTAARVANKNTTLIKLAIILASMNNVGNK